MAGTVEVVCPACHHVDVRDRDGWDGVGACAGCEARLMFAVTETRQAGVVRTEWQTHLTDRPTSTAIVEMRASGLPWPLVGLLVAFAAALGVWTGGVLVASAYPYAHAVIVVVGVTAGWWLGGRGVDAG